MDDVVTKSDCKMKSFQEMKKVLDKQNQMRYNKQAVSRETKEN